MEVDIFMARATIVVLRIAREKGISDLGLLEDWEEKMNANSQLNEEGKK